MFMPFTDVGKYQIELKIILFYFPCCSLGEDISDDLVQNSVDPIGCPSNDSDVVVTRPQFEFDAAFEAKVSYNLYHHFRKRNLIIVSSEDSECLVAASTQ